MKPVRFFTRLGNFSRRISRWCGSPEIPQGRIARFLKEHNGITPLCDKVPASLAIVLPCYGHASFLPEALKSIASQSQLPDEVIAVDDHSPDATGNLLEEHFKRFEELSIRCTLLTNDRNCGQAYSLNKGITAAKSDLIMVLNDDDYLMHDAVGLMLEIFRNSPGLALTGGPSIHFSDNEQLSAFDKIGRPAGCPLPLDIRPPSRVRKYHRYNDLNMTHSGCCFLKSAWEAAGGYFQDKGKRLVPFSDRDFQLRINALFQVAVSSAVPFSFWRSGSSVDQGRDS